MNLEQQQRQVQLMNRAARCSAASKPSGCRCRAPAVRGKSVCRFHGARAGAPKGRANGRWCHGRYTDEALTQRKLDANLIRQVREMLNTL
jgi:hypothetical protein